LVLASVMAVFSSCEKENEYPKKYVFDSFSPGEINGYTNTGQITDRLKIDGFVLGKDEHFWQSGYISEDWQVEIELISDSKARISDADTTIYYDVIRKNGIMYLQSLDTLVSYWSLTNERLQYSPLYIKNTPVPIGSGYQQVSVYLPCYYLIELSGELHIPIVCYIEQIHGSTGEFLSSQGIRNFNNVFNTAYLSKLQNTASLIDTIVFQDNKAVFVRR
jgi:hypothetical protein